MLDNFPEGVTKAVVLTVKIVRWIAAIATFYWGFELGWLVAGSELGQGVPEGAIGGFLGFGIIIVAFMLSAVISPIGDLESAEEEYQKCH